MKNLLQLTKLFLFLIFFSSFTFSQSYYLTKDPSSTGDGINEPMYYKNFEVKNLTLPELHLFFVSDSFKIDDALLFNFEDKSFDKIIIEGFNITPVMDGINIADQCFMFSITNSSKYIKQIEIRNFKFKFFRNAAIQTNLDGDIITKNLKNIKIENCEFDSLLGLQNSEQNAFIKIEGADSVIIKNNKIKNFINTANQTDGLVVKRSSNVFIENNNIDLRNDYSENTTPHVDCIQIYNAYNVQISGNIIRNRSEVTVFRTGIIIETTDGYIRIHNNVIESAYCKDLINTYFSSGTVEVSYLNNTLVGLNDQAHLLYFGNYFPATSNYLKIKNNIFYKKNVSVNKHIISFNFDPIYINFTNLSNNIYYFTNTTGIVINDPKFLFNGVNRSWNDIDNVNSFIANPGFMDNDYNISTLSPCKNKGVFSYLVSKDLKGNQRPNWAENSNDIGAYELPDAQIRINIKGPEIIPNLNHTLTYIGAYWENSDSIRLTIDDNYHNISYISNELTDNQEPRYINGFSYKFVFQNGDGNNKLLGIGFIKITASTGAYFYLDTRHFDKASNPSVVITYNTDNFRYYKNDNTIITNGSVLRLWELLNENPKTSYLENFWSNSLVVLKDGNNPRFFWSAYPDNILIPYKYKLYKKDGGMDEVLLDSLTSSTFTYKDVNAFYNNPPLPGHNISYRLKAWGDLIAEPNSPGYSTGFSNQVSIIAAGEDPAKRPGNNEGMVREFKLYQNYPNPFNPSTKIYFDLKEKGNVELSVYNVVGELIKVLVNEELDKGSYNVLFEANDLPSGIYFYSLQTPLFKKTNKMILIK